MIYYWLKTRDPIPSINGTLLPEILALVFHHATHDLPASPDPFSSNNPSRTSPLLLGSVCSYWRRLAWSTPSLWTFVDPVPIRYNAQHSDAALLRLYFKNARALPVSLHIRLDRLSSSPAAAEKLLHIMFVKNSRSIGVLMCTSKLCVPQEWAMLAPKLAQSRFPNLRRLEIHLRGSGDPFSRFDSPMFTYAPNLSRVILSGYQLPREHFWEQITVLELNSLPVCPCLESLVRCPNLAGFRCISPTFSLKHVDSAMEEHSPVTFSHLCMFEWSGPTYEWDVFLYTNIRLPNLTLLILGNSHPFSKTEDRDLWKTFLRQIKNLDTLVCTKSHSVQEWLDIFDIFSATVHTLQLSIFQDASETVRVLQALLIKYGGFASRNHFPHLKSFSAALNLYPETVTHVFDVLCSRRIRPAVPVTPTPGCVFFNALPLHPASDWSSLTRSVASSYTSALAPTTLLHARAANDYRINPVEDDGYWSTHTRLEEATIIFWGHEYDIGDGERSIARVLKENGLNLEIITCEGGVGWL